MRQSARITLYGKLAVDFFSREQHLVSGVTLRSSMRRSQDDFAVISEDPAKHYKVKIDEDNLFIRKMTVSDNVVTKEPIRRVIVALCVGTAFIGTNNANPFLYQKFGLREITIYRNGFATAGTPMSTTDNKRLYYNSMSALAYVENGHGIPLSEFANHYIMVFDLISTQEATQDFIHPEFTKSSLSVELKFDAALAHNVEIFILGEKASMIYIDSARNASKIALPMIAY